MYLSNILLRILYRVGVSSPIFKLLKYARTYDNCQAFKLLMKVVSLLKKRVIPFLLFLGRKLYCNRFRGEPAISKLG